MTRFFWVGGLVGILSNYRTQVGCSAMELSICGDQKVSLGSRHAGVEIFQYNQAARVLGREGDSHSGIRKALTHTSIKLPPGHLSKDEPLDSGTPEKQDVGMQSQVDFSEETQPGQKVISTNIFKEFHFSLLT